MDTPAKVTGSISAFSDAYKAMSPEDKEALKELQAEEVLRTGRTVSLGDIVRAVTPGLETPAFLK